MTTSWLICLILESSEDRECGLITVSSFSQQNATDALKSLQFLEIIGGLFNESNTAVKRASLRAINNLCGKSVEFPEATVQVRPSTHDVFEGFCLIFPWSISSLLLCLCVMSCQRTIRRGHLKYYLVKKTSGIQVLTQKPLFSSRQLIWFWT